jgi:hypothetical protein
MTKPASPPRIIFLNRCIYPGQAPTGELLSSLAFALARRGFQVEVIAAGYATTIARRRSDREKSSMALESGACGRRNGADKILSVAV